MIEYNAFKDLVPKTQRGLITPEFVDKLNEWNTDPKLVDSFKENLLSYTGVLKDGKYKIEDYVYAVKYVSYKLLGSSDIDAYAITFPDRYQRLSDEGLDRNGISPYAAAYKKNKLVNAIIEQTLVPSHVLNAPLHQEALNELAYIMCNGKSEMARVNAATAILAATKQPEKTKIELDISVNNKDAISELRRATEELASAQLESIKAGVSVKVVAESRITDAEICDE
jgi:hypothetical protein